MGNNGVSLNIAAGQGITQAIVSKLGLNQEQCKKINLQTWQQVMTEVKNAQDAINNSNSNNASQTDFQAKPSIFTGGNNVKKINKSDQFIVQQGAIQLDSSTWTKICNLLGASGQDSEKLKEKPPLDILKVEPPKVDIKPVVIDIPELELVPEDAKQLTRDIVNIGDDGSEENVAMIKKGGVKTYRQVVTDGIPHLGQRLVADRRGLMKNEYYAVNESIPDGAEVDRKTVNGKKDVLNYEIEDENGKKHRYTMECGEDGIYHKGEELISINGDFNKYATKSGINEGLKRLFYEQGEDSVTFEGLKGMGIEVLLLKRDGDTMYIFKKDGQRITNEQVYDIVTGNSKSEYL